MNKYELQEKLGIELLKIVSFWEDTETFKPFWYKSEKIAKEAHITNEEADNALRMYQHFMEA